MATVIEVMARLSGNPAGMIAAMRAGQTAAHDMAEGTTSSSQRTRTALTGLHDDIQRNRGAWKMAGNASLIFGAAALVGVGMVVKAYAGFDKQMSNVQAATHATGAEMDSLRGAAIQAGADTAYSAIEAGQGIEELAKAGVSTTNILKGGLTGALSLAAAGGLGVGEAAEIAASALTQFGLKGRDIPHVADLLSAAAGKAQGSVHDMGAALNMSGLVAAQTGLSIEETTGALGAFASAGLTGSDAGTSFKTMLMRLTPNSKEAADKLKELNISAYDANGNFMGLSALAGNLQTSMATLTPEARNAAMGIIFGSDAVRAANILYKEGASGIEAWIAKVNDAGYAASTAAIKQDNLAGDIEKLGGSIDSVFLKSGSGANDVLRDMVSAVEGIVDWIGSLDPKVLQLGVSFLATTGFVALAAGGLMKLVPVVSDAVRNFTNLGTAGGPAPGMLGKIAKAAGIAAIALAALSFIGMIFTDKARTSTEEYANAIMKVSVAGNAAKASDLDSLFQSFDKFAGKSTVDDINGMGDAIAKLARADWSDNVNQFFDGFTGMFNLPQSALGQLDGKLRGLGETLGEITQGGGAESAAKTFRLLSEEFEKNGKSSQDALDKMPAYRDALMAQAAAAGIALEPQELLSYAMGLLPEGMQAAAESVDTYRNSVGQSVPVTEAMASALAEIGIKADGVIVSLGNFVDAMQRAGLMSMSERDAARGYAEALEGVGLKADGTGGKIGALGREFDNSTEKGRANQATFDGVAKAGMNLTNTMAKQTDAYGNNVYSQSQLQGQLGTTFTNLVRTAGQFGITGTAADDLARDVMGIPKGANINTWMSDYAKRMADQTTGAVNGIPANKSVNVGIKVYGMDQIEAARQALGNLAANSMITANAYASGAAYRKFNGGPIEGFASGGFPNGLIEGTGTGTSDSILARVSNGEFIMRASAVGQYGKDMMRSINSGTYRPPATKSGANYSSAAQSGTSAVSLTPNFNVVLEIPGLGESLTARIVSVSEGAVGDAFGSLTRAANTGRGTTQGVYVS